MGNVFIYAPDAEDFTTIGICGALTPTEGRFTEHANGDSEITMEHPIDALNRYTTLTEGRILRVDVPVRTVPELAGGAFISRVEKWVVRSTASVANRYIYSTADPSAKKQKKLKLVPVGGQVIVVATYANEGLRWKVKYSWREQQKKRKKRVWVDRTVTGYIDHDETTLQLVETNVDIPATNAGIEAVAPSWEVTPQLFRIDRVDKGINDVTVHARHISYDLMYNMTGYNADGSKTLQEAADEMLAAAFDRESAAAFTFQTNIAGSKVGFHYRDKDPITALLDPDIGLIPRWGGQLVRDNYNLVCLDQAGVNRGIVLEYGKNIKGLDMELDMSNVTTAIRPVGEAENGNPIYLPQSYILDSDYNAHAISGDNRGIVFGTWHSLEDGQVTCRLPHARIFSLNGEDCKENKKDGPNVATVRARLLQQTIAALRNGAEQPDVSVDVDMELLGYTSQYELYRAMEKIFLFDTVRARNRRMNIDVEVTVSELEWDFLNDRPVGLRLGTVMDLTPSVASWQIRSVDGAKLIPNSVTATQLGDQVVTARHILSESITTDHLAAYSVTANKLAAGAVDAQALTAVTAAINAITASTISTNTLSAAFAHLFRVVAGNIEAGTVTAGALDAVMASVVALTARTGDFDLATVQNLLSSALVLRQGQADGMQIVNLAVTSANLLNATVGKLVVKGDDGRYYEVGVGSDGVIRTAEYDATPGEIADGETADGRQIVEEAINARAIAGQTIRASEAALGRVLTAALTAGQITADDALLASASIPLLYATSIRALGDSLDLSANESVTIAVGEAVNGLRFGARNYLRNGRALTWDGVYGFDAQTVPVAVCDLFYCDNAVCG